MGMMIHRAKMRQVRQAMYEPEIKPESEEIKEEIKEVEYSFDEINALPFFSLKSVAIKYGIDVKGKKAADLRAELIKKMGL